MKKPFIVHNTLDFDCAEWIGDMRPHKNDLRNRDFGGASTRLDFRRCLICRPYTETEADELLALSEYLV